jgi:hypothetical protein
MSREQLTDQQSQQDETTSGSATTEETYGLPQPVYEQVMRLGPGNVEGLRDLLARYPNFSQGILSVASHHMGAAAVRQAVKRPGGLTQDQIRPGGEFALEGDAPKPGLTQDQIRPGGEFALEGDAPKPRLTQDQIRPGGEFALEGEAPKPRLTQEQIRPGGEFALEGDAPKPRLTQEQIRPGGEFALEGNAPTAAAVPAWVAGARKYNEAHTDLVSNFNVATGGSCLGSDGQLDPQAVSAWQRAHGLDPDGKVGPLTVAAAQRVSAKPASAGTGAGIPV